MNNIEKGVFWFGIIGFMVFVAVGLIVRLVNGPISFRWTSAVCILPMISVCATLAKDLRTGEFVHTVFNNKLYKFTKSQNPFLFWFSLVTSFLVLMAFIIAAIGIVVVGGIA